MAGQFGSRYRPEVRFCPGPDSYFRPARVPVTRPYAGGMGHRGWAAATGVAVFAAAALAVVLGAMAPGPLLGSGLIGCGLIGMVVLGGAAVRTLPPLPAAAIGVVGTAVIAVGETVGPGGLFDHRTVWAAAGVTVWSAGLAVGLYLRYLDFMQRQTLEAARRDGRLELARELHDAVAHHVTGIVVQAQAARFTGGEHPDRLISALGSIETAGADTLAAIRQLVGLLRNPDEGAGVSPGPEAIGELVERFATHGPAVDLRLPDGPPAAGWPPELVSTVYRIVQEALTNVARHAPGAQSVTVTLTHGSGQVRVEVTDDAPASRRTRPGGGYGLVGMGERVAALGGKVSAGPLPGAGWAVEASLPIPAQAQP